MSAVLGIDLSTRAIDLVRLDENTNAATWDHLELQGKTAFERLRSIYMLMPGIYSTWFDGVYLVAIEAPMSRGQMGTLAKLSRVFGAVVGCIRPELELWEVAPVQWRKELGLSGHATKEVCAEAVIELGAPAGWLSQDAYDAYAVAYYARELNARALV